MSQPINHTEAEFPKVLVIDDEASILQSIKRLLRRHNINVLLAQSGQEGLELLTKHDVQLVICDMKMPNMTGAELFTQVAKRYPNIYRILLTGFSDVDSTIDAINLGKIDRYVQKPWDNDHLV